MAWYPVFRRNLLVWQKLAIPSLIGHIAEPMIWLIALGYGLGSFIGSIEWQGQSILYSVFFASGSICMSATNATTFEALYSVFSRMQVQKTWDGILNSPLRIEDIFFAELLWSSFKGMLSACTMLAVMLALGLGRDLYVIWVLPILLLTCLTFASIALIFNALAKGYDFFTYYFTLFLTPMTFLSGIFFPLDRLPSALQYLSTLLPLTHVVALVRPLFIGHSPDNILLHISVLLVYGVSSAALALHLTKKRFAD
ncbi:MAG: ABC transporter permease [Gammaproteobacteria bacterium]|nr:ABC transporter permease [Gammaproteobacteria bacterium]